MALADDRRGQCVHLEAALVHATMGSVGVHAQAGGLARQVRVLGHLDVRIPDIVHAHQRRSRLGGGDFLGRQHVRIADGIDDDLALGGEGGGECHAHGVIAFQRRARDRAIHIQADVLRVVGNQVLNRAEEFHLFLLSSRAQKTRICGL
ncbi:hypothetical protein D3C87_1329320 [compost metagenome]